MSEAGPDGDDGSEEVLPELQPVVVRWRLRDHIGVVSGVVLGLVALAVLVLIAAAGDPGALGILVVIVIGIALIFFGSQLHGSRSRR
jgi:uncharacterized membrane protein HdeD (DUF308 family)